MSDRHIKSNSNQSKNKTITIVLSRCRRANNNKNTFSNDIVLMHYHNERW
jgi:hypothetical protein